LSRIPINKAAVMARPREIIDQVVRSIKFEQDDYRMLRDIATLETLRGGKVVSTHALVREAIKFVYGDNERLRECFRRARLGVTSRKKK
jgi:hypothetical protein